MSPGINQSNLNLIASDATDLRKKVMETKRVVSSQRPARVREAIGIAERILARLRAQLPNDEATTETA